MEDFFRVFLDIRLPFVAFGGSIIRVLQVLSCYAGFASGRWASLMTPEYGYKEFDAPPVRSLRDRSPWARLTSNSINRGLAAMPAQERSIPIDGAALAAINPTTAPAPRGNGKEYVAQGVEVRVPTAHNPAVGRCADWDHGARRGGGPSRAPAVVAFQFGLSSVRRQFCSAAAAGWRGERWVKRLAVVIARAGRDLRRLFRRAVVAARRRAHQSRHCDAVACGRDRGQYRPRQYRRGRRHADRAGRADPHRGAHPRYRRPRPRPRHRRHRAEGRGETIRHGAADGAAARRKPQSGRCRTRGAHYAGRPGHGFRRRHRQAARDRRRLEDATRACRRHSRARSVPPPPSPPRLRLRCRDRARRPRHRTDCWPASTGSTV